MKKILIIDDSVFAVRVLTDILKDTYEVISANSGKEGIASAIKHQPALILLDIEMPEMDGFEVLKILKEEKVTKPIPVIFLTGVIDSKYEEQGFLYGAVDYIVKPYNSNVVKVRVNTHVNLAEYSRKIEKQLNIDTLTDVHNRRGLEHYINEAVGRAIEEQRVFNCIMFDVDYFKVLNDTYGHLQGDRALQQVAGILKDCVPSDKGYVARYGGEEFAIILPDMNGEEVKDIIRQIYQEIKNARIPNEKSMVSDWLTISSGGVGGFLQGGDQGLEFVRAADEMLYRSKRGGRNRFTWCENQEEAEFCY